MIYKVLRKILHMLRRVFPRDRFYRLIAHFLPIHGRRVVFSCAQGNGYNGNPRAVYEELVRQGLDQKLDCIWIMQRRKETDPIPGKRRIVHHGTLRAAIMTMAARVWVFDTRDPAWLVKRSGQYYLQTWHGTPLKKLALDMDDHLNMEGDHDIERYHANFRRDTAKWDGLIVQNDFSEQIFRRCFAFDREFLRFGYPRNDVLFRKNDPESIREIRERLGIPEDRKILLYAPTYRDDVIQDYSYSYKPEMDFKQMQMALGDEWILIVKLHYFIAEKTDWSEYTGFVYDFGNQADICELYLIADRMITDYSSVMFDYAILNRPIYFYCYDLEKYREELRGFYFDFLEEAPGPVVRTTEELLKEIREGSGKKYERKMQAFRRKYHEYDSGTASEQVVKKICALTQLP